MRGRDLGGGGNLVKRPHVYTKRATCRVRGGPFGTRVIRRRRRDFYLAYYCRRDTTRPNVVHGNAGGLARNPE